MTAALRLCGDCVVDSKHTRKPFWLFQSLGYVDRLFQCRYCEEKTLSISQTEHESTRTSSSQSIYIDRQNRKAKRKSDRKSGRKENTAAVPNTVAHLKCH